MNARNINHQHRYPPVITASKLSGKAPSLQTAAHLGGLRGQELKAAIASLNVSDLVSFFASDAVGSIVKTVAVEFVDGIESLIALTSRELPAYVRSNALRRIDGVLEGDPLDANCAAKLLPCLDHPALIGRAIELMNGAGFDWCSHATVYTTEVLCAALYNSKGIMEEVLAEDAFDQLVFKRPDLRPSLHACSPERVQSFSASPSKPLRHPRFDYERAGYVA